MYRISRNIEASLVKYIEEELEDAEWTNITVVKGFNNAITTSMTANSAIISIRVGPTDPKKIEVGSNNIVKNIQVLIDLFCSDDGQRLDLKDFLVDVLKEGCTYYLWEKELVGREYQYKTPTANGNINVISIKENPIDFDTDKSKLEVHDRYRHLITLEVTTGKVE